MFETRGALNSIACATSRSARVIFACHAAGSRHAFQIVLDESFVDSDSFGRIDPVVISGRR